MSAPRAIVIGASAGGVLALRELLPRLPAGLDATVLVVLHLPPDRPSLLSGIFRRACRVPVVEAEDKAPLAPGTIVFAPPDYHLLVDRGPAIALSVDEPVAFSRPAIDVLFETAAEIYGSATTGLILTGASHDGAAGLAAGARDASRRARGGAAGRGTDDRRARGAVRRRRPLIQPRPLPLPLPWP